MPIGRSISVKGGPVHWFENGLRVLSPRSCITERDVVHANGADGSIPLGEPRRVMFCQIIIKSLVEKTNVVLAGKNDQSCA